MITESRRRRSPHIIEIALVLSLLLHVLLLAFFRGRWLAVPEKSSPRDQIITLSSAVTIEHRKKAVPVPHPRPQPQVVPAPRAVAQVMPQPQIAVPTYQPIRVPPPAHPITVPELHKETESQTKPATLPENHVKAHATDTLTPEQIAAIQAQAAKTIALARSADNPLDVPTEKPVAPKHYAMQVPGIHDGLNPGEGTSDHIGPGWRYGQLNCYYANYQVVYADGTYESGDVPWPVCWLPKDDPYLKAERYGIRVNFDFPPPLPGYKLPPDVSLKPALQPYFPDRYPNARE